MRFPGNGAVINDNTYPRYLLEIAIEQIHLTVIAFVYVNKVKNKQFFNYKTFYEMKKTL